MQRPSEHWTDAVLETQAIHDDGHFEEAASRYVKLRESAPRPQDRRWVTYELAILERDRGNDGRALELLEKLWREPVVDAHGARALYDASEIHARQGNHEISQEMRFAAIARYPNEMGAELALETLVEYYRSRGLHETVSKVMRTLHKEISESYLADNVLYFLAQNEDRYLDDPDAAIVVYHEIFVNHPESGLADDALWEATLIYRRHQRWKPAIHNLTIMANDVETSWFVGNYNSPWLDNAIYDLGMINLLFVEDYDEAVRYFDRYTRDFEFSTLADDAAWHACEARRLQKADAAHLQCLKRFVQNYPESRYRQRAAGRLGISLDEL